MPRRSESYGQIYATYNTSSAASPSLGGGGGGGQCTPNNYVNVTSEHGDYVTHGITDDHQQQQQQGRRRDDVTAAGYDDTGRWLCEQCNHKLRELRRRATKMWVAYNNASLQNNAGYQVKNKQTIMRIIADRVTSHESAGSVDVACWSCGTTVRQLIDSTLHGIQRLIPLTSSSTPGQPDTSLGDHARQYSSVDRNQKASDDIPETMLSTPGAAISFFARATEQLRPLSNQKRAKRHHHQRVPSDQMTGGYPTNFSSLLQTSPPSLPEHLTVASGGKHHRSAHAKVKLLLRLSPAMNDDARVAMTVDTLRRQVTLCDRTEGARHVAPPSQRSVFVSPKIFAFDGVFSAEDDPVQLNAAVLGDVLEAVVSGSDGCIISFGHARLGKTYTMIGQDDSVQHMGVIPSAIAWLFKLIEERRTKTNTRFSVRVSAVEVTGKDETVRDLLASVAKGKEAEVGTAPNVYLRDEMTSQSTSSSSSLEHKSELRAPTAQQAAHYLDAAIAARTVPEVYDEARRSHFIFALNVYQYRVEKNGGGSEVAGGRSRLHLIDLGSGSREKDGKALSLSAIGNVLLALLSGQRHTAYRDSILTQLLYQSIFSSTCHVTMVAHVSPLSHAYVQTLHVLQMTAKIQRVHRRIRTRASRTSSDDSSCDDSGKSRGWHSVVIDNRLSRRLSCISDTDGTSGSEVSGHTVVFLGDSDAVISDAPDEGEGRQKIETRSQNGGDDDAAVSEGGGSAGGGSGSGCSGRVSKKGHHQQRFSDGLKSKIAEVCSSATPRSVSPFAYRPSARAHHQQQMLRGSKLRMPSSKWRPLSNCHLTTGSAKPNFEECWIDGPALNNSNNNNNNGQDSTTSNSNVVQQQNNTQHQQPPTDDKSSFDNTPLSSTSLSETRGNDAIQVNSSQQQTNAKASTVGTKEADKTQDTSLLQSFEESCLRITDTIDAMMSESNDVTNDNKHQQFVAATVSKPPLPTNSSNCQVPHLNAKSFNNSNNCTAGEEVRVTPTSLKRPPSAASLDSHASETSLVVNTESGLQQDDDEDMHSADNDVTFNDPDLLVSAAAIGGARSSVSSSARQHEQYLNEWINRYTSSDGDALAFTASTSPANNKQSSNKQSHKSDANSGTLNSTNGGAGHINSSSPVNAGDNSQRSANQKRGAMTSPGSKSHHTAAQQQQHPTFQQLLLEKIRIDEIGGEQMTGELVATTVDYDDIDDKMSSEFDVDMDSAHSVDLEALSGYGTTNGASTFDRRSTASHMSDVQLPDPGSYCPDLDLAVNGGGLHASDLHQQMLLRCGVDATKSKSEVTGAKATDSYKAAVKRVDCLTVGPGGVVVAASRESVYEHDVENVLEACRGDASHRMTFASEDDAWSTPGSLRRPYSADQYTYMANMSPHLPEELISAKLAELFQDFRARSDLSVPLADQSPGSSTTTVQNQVQNGLRQGSVERADGGAGHTKRVSHSSQSSSHSNNSEKSATKVHFPSNTRLPPADADSLSMQGDVWAKPEQPVSVSNNVQQLAAHKQQQQPDKTSQHNHRAHPKQQEHQQQQHKMSSSTSQSHGDRGKTQNTPGHDERLAAEPVNKRLADIQRANRLPRYDLAELVDYPPPLQQQVNGSPHSATNRSTPVLTKPPLPGVLPAVSRLPDTVSHPHHLSSKSHCTLIIEPSATHAHNTTNAALTNQKTPGWFKRKKSKSRSLMSESSSDESSRPEGKTRKGSGGGKREVRPVPNGGGNRFLLSTVGLGPPIPPLRRLAGSVDVLAPASPYLSDNRSSYHYGEQAIGNGPATRMTSHTHHQKHGRPPKWKVSGHSSDTGIYGNGGRSHKDTRLMWMSNRSDVGYMSETAADTHFTSFDSNPDMIDRRQLKTSAGKSNDSKTFSERASNLFRKLPRLVYRAVSPATSRS